MGGLRPWHIAVLVVVLILLFGAKRLPDMARSLGKSMRIMKSEVKGLQEDDVEGKAEAQHGREPLEPRQLDHQPNGQVHDGRPVQDGRPVNDPVEHVRDK